MTTKFSLLKDYWTKLSHADSPKSPNSLPSLGGKIIIIDWDDKKIIWNADFDMPMGLFISDNLLFANTLNNEIIGIDKNKNFHLRLTNPLFNGLHSLEKTDRGFLITSSGLDLVAEIDYTGSSIFEWWAIDHGFNVLPSGEHRSIDKLIDHKKMIYPLNSQTTHINSATVYGDKYILSTLFHQGMLIRINRESLEYDVLQRGLSKPHAIHCVDQGFVLSDTFNNRALLLDHNFNIKEAIKGGFSWVQDTISTSRASFVIVDADNKKLVEVQRDVCGNYKIIANFYCDQEWRVFQVVEISSNQLNKFLS